MSVSGPKNITLLPHTLELGWARTEQASEGAGAMAA